MMPQKVNIGYCNQISLQEEEADLQWMQILWVVIHFQLPRKRYIRNGINTEFCKYPIVLSASKKYFQTFHFLPWLRQEP